MTTLRLLWHLLCGRPLMYRMHLMPGEGMVNLHPTMRAAWIYDCQFDAGVPPPGPSASYYRTGTGVREAPRAQETPG